MGRHSPSHGGMTKPLRLPDLPQGLIWGVTYTREKGSWSLLSSPSLTFPTFPLSSADSEAVVEMETSAAVGISAVETVEASTSAFDCSIDDCQRAGERFNAGIVARGIESLRRIDIERRMFGRFLKLAVVASALLVTFACGDSSAGPDDTSTPPPACSPSCRRPSLPWSGTSSGSQLTCLLHPTGSLNRRPRNRRRLNTHTHPNQPTPRCLPLHLIRQLRRTRQSCLHLSPRLPSLQLHPPPIGKR